MGARISANTDIAKGRKDHTVAWLAFVGCEPMPSGTNPMPYAKAHRQEKWKARAAERRALGLCQNCNNRTANARCDACKVRYGRKAAKPLISQE